MPTTVVNIRTDEYDYYCARGSILGNPYEIGIDGTREQVIARYRKWFKFLLKSEFFRKELAKLKGKRIGCFCKEKGKDVACHLDVVAEYLDSN